MSCIMSGTSEPLHVNWFRIEFQFTPYCLEASPDESPSTDLQYYSWVVLSRSLNFFSINYVCMFNYLQIEMHYWH